MTALLKRSAAVVPAALTIFAGAAVLAPALGSATQCGPGTVYDPPTDSCVLPPPPPPGPWNAPPPPPAPLGAPPPPSVLPPGMPPIQICPPIPFVPVCFPVN